MSTWKPLLAAAAALLPATTLAQAPAPAAAPAAPPLVGGSDFISPVGQPFHSQDALSGAEHWFAAADADHDGRLTRAEFRADAMRFFASLDVDHDREIGPAEIDRYETDVAPEIRVNSTYGAYTGREAEGEEPPYPNRLGAGRFGYVDLPEPVVAMDTNFDRGVSEAEFTRAADHRFGLLDANHDGALTRDELPRLKPSSGPGSGEKRRRRRG